MKTLLSLLLAAAVVPVQTRAEADPKSAFEQLKALAGSWQGTVMRPDGPKTTVDYRITSGGQTVMELLFGGTSHEMISMYHLDGPDLVITHFCAMGNQPRMRLDRAASSPRELVFVFAGGSNLDPGKDVHIHNGRIRLVGSDRVEADWTLFQDGKPTGTNTFFLNRAAAKPAGNP